METEIMIEETLLHINGMSCVNCQNKIEHCLRHIDGVISAHVSYHQAAAHVSYDINKVSLEDMTAAIDKLGYQVVYDERSQSPDFVKNICLLIIIVSLYILLQSFGILNLLAPSQLADTAMGYGMIFVIGLVTSVHCIAMCGGINLSQCIPRAKAEEKSKLSTFGPALFYNMGRVLSYTIIGFVLGLASFVAGGGTGAQMSVTLQGILKMIAGLYMVIMGINMLGIFPWLRRFSLRMPRFVAHKIGRERTKVNVPFIVGLLNGLMPCGPLQSMWIVALAAGNPAAGALSMLLFSLGTVPLMLGFGTIVSALGKKFTEKAMAAGAVMIVVLGFAMLSQGGSLSGWISSDLLLYLMIAFFAAGVLISVFVHKRVLKAVVCMASLAVMAGLCIFGNVWKTDSAKDSDIMIADGVQIVSSTLEPGSYPDIVVQEGVPVRWIIEAPEGSINGCNYKMFIQEYGIEYEFQQGENVIEFTPEHAGAVSYSCWMGMIHGNIYVTES